MPIKMADPESICSVSHVGVVDEDEEGDSINKDGNAAHGASACSFTTTAKTVVKEKTSLTDQVDSSTTALVPYMQACSPVEDSDVLKYEATPDAKENPTKEVVFDASENSSGASEALDGNELGHPACGRLMGSILKSIEAKAAFLQLVAEVVERLHSHTLDTIGAHEMQVVQKWADDAAAVGFHVEWLQHRIKQVVAISKYRDSLTQLNEIKEQIAAAKIALLEMQLQQIILKKEIDSNDLMLNESRQVLLIEMSSQLGWDREYRVVSSFYLYAMCQNVDDRSCHTLDSMDACPGVPAVGSTIAVSSSSSAPAQTPSALVVASSSGTTSTTSAVLASAPKLPSEITGKTVEEIIKEWNSELQERTGKFRKQANAIAEWDRRILQNRDILLKLESEVAKVVETQGSLERQLELIETHQDEVDKALQSMEEEAERIYREERGLLLDDDAASTRDAMYEQAELIERELEQMTEHIKSIISTLNACHGGELEAADGMTPLDVVVRI
ncbi:UNVERIFIED_CONTAM: Nuclear pore complex protein [Sesamum angustifolium]|uniref:Nuclear pore complex protein n=1 Tax=Sesamum angustifolium TaxID=2727405 RepID=A0AAW2RI18_9LAMI